jgi:hypothetical protein
VSSTLARSISRLATICLAVNDSLLAPSTARNASSNSADCALACFPATSSSAFRRTVSDLATCIFFSLQSTSRIFWLSKIMLKSHFYNTRYHVSLIPRLLSSFLPSYTSTRRLLFGGLLPQGWRLIGCNLHRTSAFESHSQKAVVSIVRAP